MFSHNYINGKKKDFNIKLDLNFLSTKLFYTVSMVVKALIVTWDQFFNSHVVLFSVANFLAKLLLLV